VRERSWRQRARRGLAGGVCAAGAGDAARGGRAEHARPHGGPRVNGEGRGVKKGEAPLRHGSLREEEKRKINV